MIPKVQSFCKIIYVIKGIILVVCFSIFIYLMTGVWIKFNTRSTTTITSLIDNYYDDMQLPCFTVCPMKGFKNSGFFYRKASFMSNSYSADEILNYNLTSETFKDQFEIYEVRTHRLGRCYTICFKNQVSEDEVSFIKLKRSVDLLGEI